MNAGSGTLIRSRAQVSDGQERDVIAEAAVGEAQGFVEQRRRQHFDRVSAQLRERGSQSGFSKEVATPPCLREPVRVEQQAGALRDVDLKVVVAGIAKHSERQTGGRQTLRLAVDKKQWRWVPGGGVDESPSFRVEKTEERGDKTGKVLLHEKSVGLAEDKVRPPELMSEGVDDVLHESGDPSGLQPVPGHVADEKGDAALFGLEYVVEVTAHPRLLSGRPVEVAETDRSQFRRDMQKGALDVLCDLELLAVEALVLFGKEAIALLALADRFLSPGALQLSPDPVGRPLGEGDLVGPGPGPC